MEANAMVIVTLCSHLCAEDGVEPLGPREWSELAKRLTENAMQPKDLLTCPEDRLRALLGGSDAAMERFSRLLGRGGSLRFELDRYKGMGIRAVTRADSDYPRELKRKLGSGCPPLFYCAGDTALLAGRAAGFVGSRDICEEDLTFTSRAVAAVLQRGYQVVSGGARGVDQAAEQAALGQGGSAIVYLADPLLKRLKNSAVVRAVQEGRLLLLSAVRPDAGFHTGTAMMRNRYIYAQSAGTVVVRADLNKGGTWTGATENLRHGWCPLFCWNNAAYPGNAALIEKGAAPIGANWDGDLAKTAPLPKAPVEQLSLFG